MTEEKARKAAEVMIAYAEGKEIEFKPLDYNTWCNVIGDPLFDWSHNDYRIKSKPKYRPFKDKEECWTEMQKHQPFGWVKEHKFSHVYHGIHIRLWCTSFTGL